ncbi:acyltransferase family protein [Streptacidiphilus fuscans]|uniref:Acyltransferase n=1 Tax=Streptacidiphilus fuscans TaxID=2789292 RepID=A0A931FDP2_9ACTN|nr:acyltransferase [Streptacidiphilus fuscans]MBF9070922.1 acyltransferase [Streptacidiphilus fuscans]
MRRLTHAEFLALRRFDALDGLRAVAAVIVVFFHTGGPQSSFLSGWIGVHIFFVVSGFLITTLMLREHDRNGRISLRDFYLRRVFRIMPLYYLVLLFTAIAAYHQAGQWAALKQHLPHFLLFMNEYHIPPGVPYLQTWTIGIEWKFYLVWPLLLVAVGAVAARLRIPLALLAFVLVLVPYNQTWSGMGVHYGVLLIGALLALVLHSPRGFALVSPLTHPLVAGAVAVGFLALHASIPALVTRFHGEQTPILIYGVGVALLLPGLLAPGPGRWLLSRRPFVVVGERSYGLSWSRPWPRPSWPPSSRPRSWPGLHLSSPPWSRWPPWPSPTCCTRGWRPR